MADQRRLELLIDSITSGNYLANRPDGEVYKPLSNYPTILAINGTLIDEQGLHARPCAKLVKKAEALGISYQRGYAVFNGSHASLRSVIGLLMLVMRKGSVVSLVTQDVSTEHMIELYETLPIQQP